MSRSIKKTPRCTFGTDNHNNQTKWFRDMHRAYRRYEKQQINKGNDDIKPFKYYANLWSSPADGYQYSWHKKEKDLYWKKCFLFK